jgi:anti-sigma-K factor RskA
MYDDDRDALAAEYVLGTLSTDERDQAEALLAIDPGFAEIVRVWERRLGELNVMVEAVEPRAELWDRIRSDIGEPEPQAEAAAPDLTEAAPLLAPESAAEIEPAAEPGPQFELAPSASEAPQDLDAAAPPQDLDAALTAPRDLDDEATIAALASSLLSPEVSESEAAAEAVPPELVPPPPPAEGRGADIIRLQRGVRRWRGFTAAMTAIAAMLALFVAVSQFAPGLLPGAQKMQQPVVAAKPPATGDRFVAVLQQEPTAPAFLLTVNPQSRTLTVRRISAAAESGRSYELWLVAGKMPKSLGLVGGDEFTTRPIPANFDVDAMRGATYAVSLEPAGGSPSGAPTGPILFTGKMVESLPGSPT